MSGLVGYGSSDEEEEISKLTEKSSRPESHTHSTEVSETKSNSFHGAKKTRPERPIDDAPLGPISGPSLGPQGSQVNVVEDGNVSAPESPYSAARSMARDLTLPSIPNLDIPNSPPGSPPPGMQKKMTHFLELKKQGIHFNEKLAQSSALKNPSLLSKLMTAVGMEGDEQYVTTLPKDLWDPSGFPSWAYKEELAKAQQEAQKKREEEAARTPRDSIDFVSASVSGQSSRSGTPGLGSSRGQKASAAERVMAGLDRDRARQLPRSELTSRATHSRKRSRSR